MSYPSRGCGYWQFFGNQRSSQWESHDNWPNTGGYGGFNYKDQQKRIRWDQNAMRGGHGGSYANMPVRDEYPVPSYEYQQRGGHLGIHVKWSNRCDNEHSSNREMESMNKDSDLAHVVLWFDCEKNGTYKRNTWEIAVENLFKADNYINLEQETGTINKNDSLLCMYIFKYNDKELVCGEGSTEAEAAENAVLLLINKLARTNYTIKAKADYFALTPTKKIECPSEKEGVYKIVYREEVASAVKSFIFVENFLREKPTSELIFGDDFSPNFLCAVDKFVSEHEDLYKLRYVSPTQIGVSNILTPQFIRDNLLAGGPLTEKYELIPPLGEGKNLIPDLACTGFLPDPQDEIHMEVNIIPSMTKARRKMMNKRLARHQLAAHTFQAGRKLTKKEKSTVKRKFWESKGVGKRQYQ